jgi:hypothetical protein
MTDDRKRQRTIPLSFLPFSIVMHRHVTVQETLVANKPALFIATQRVGVLQKHVLHDRSGFTEGGSIPKRQVYVFIDIKKHYYYYILQIRFNTKVQPP